MSATFLRRSRMCGDSGSQKLSLLYTHPALRRGSMDDLCQGLANPGIAVSWLTLLRASFIHYSALTCWIGWETLLERASGGNSANGGMRHAVALLHDALPVTARLITPPLGLVGLAW